MLHTKLLLGGNATKEAVLAKLADARLAHFACHATFNRDSPFKSGIKLANGILTAREVLEQGLRMPDFLSLSACETGMAKRLGGDELAGLSQVFLQAGAKSLLVSLWPVADNSAAALMTGFYKAWHNDDGTGRKDKAVALHGAMAAIRKAHPEWDHPYYWGAKIEFVEWASPTIFQAR